MYKKILNIFLVILIFSLSFTSFSNSNDLEVSVPTFDVKINGVKINIKDSQYPLIIYNDITYFPMTSDYVSNLGLDLKFNQNEGLRINKGNIQKDLEQQFLNGKNVLGSKKLATKVPFTVKVNGSLVENSKEKYPILFFNDVTYFPLTWKFAVEKFKWDLDFSASDGLEISSTKDRLKDNTTINNDQNNYQEGYNVKVYPDGTKYKGNWEDGRYNGYGEYFFPNGNKLEALFEKDNVKNKGSLYDKEENLIYQGEFNQDYEYSGVGEYYFDNGDIYKGEFKNGKFDGEGQIVSSNGNIEKGIWKNGQKIKELKAKLSTKELAKFEESIVLIKAFDKNDNQLSTGSGVIIKSNGLILTNNHVIKDAYYYKIIFSNKDSYITYAPLNISKNQDLALLKVNRTSKPLQLGNYNNLSKGQSVVAIGNPLGYTNTISQGIISAFRNIDNVKYIQTNASISPGSSGGGLLNSYGELIGITTSTSAKESSQNINFAVSSADIEKFLNKDRTKLEIYLRDYYSYLSHDGENFDIAFVNNLDSTGTYNISMITKAKGNSELSNSVKSNVPIFLMDMAKNISKKFDFENLKFTIWFKNEYFTINYDNGKFKDLIWNDLDNSDSLSSNDTSNSDSKKLSAENIKNYLLKTYKYINLNNRNVEFNSFQVNINESKKEMIVWSYIDNKGIKEFIDAYADDRKKLLDGFEIIGADLLDKYDYDVFLNIIYSDFLYKMPHEYYYFNQLNDNTVQYYADKGYWFIYYPFINIEFKVDSDKYYYRFDH